MSATDARATPDEHPVSRPVSKGMPGRRLVLKLYRALQVPTLSLRLLWALGLEPHYSLDFVPFATFAASLPALLGYAFRRGIGSAWLWKAWLPVPLAWIVVSELGLFDVPVDHQGFSPGQWLAGYLFDGPVYVALYLYAFRSPEIWQRS